jgi:hypothetical protein
MPVHLQIEFTQYETTFAFNRFISFPDQLPK